MKRETMIVLLAGATGFLLLAMLAIFVEGIFLKKKKSVPKKEEEKLLHKVSAAREIVAPDRIDPIPLSYFILNDNGQDLYVRSFTIDSLPKRTVFASTFSVLFNFSE